MAKKSITHIQIAWSVSIKPGAPGKNLMKIKGQNSKGTEVNITIELSDWFLPHLTSECHEAARDKFKAAHEILTRVRESVKSI